MKMFAFVGMFVLMDSAIHMGVQVRMRQTTEGVQNPPNQIGDAKP
jgi:hypothetical protein